MALQFDIAPPKWLSDEIAWARGTGERAEQSLYRGLAFGLQAAQARERVLTEQVQRTNEAQKMAIQNEERSAWLEDVNAGVPKWLTRGPDDDSPAPAAKSLQGISAIEKRQQFDENIKLRKSIQTATEKYRNNQVEIGKQRADNSSAEEKMLAKRDENFLNGLSGLDDATVAGVTKFPKDQKGHYTQEAWQALETARSAKGLQSATITSKTAGVPGSWERLNNLYERQLSENKPVQAAWTKAYMDHLSRDASEASLKNTLRRDLVKAEAELEAAKKSKVGKYKIPGAESKVDTIKKALAEIDKGVTATPSTPATSLTPSVTPMSPTDFNNWLKEKQPTP